MVGAPYFHSDKQTGSSETDICQETAGCAGGGSGTTEYDRYSIVYSGVVQSIAASVCQGVQVSGENCSTRY